MQAISNIEKNMTVGTGSSAYKAVSSKDVVNECRKAMIANGLVLMPIGVEESSEVERWTEQTNYNGKVETKNKQQVFTKVIAQYVLMHESGESIILCGYGHGVDSQDKSAGKATTYANKNTLIYTFQIPIGDIDDTDNDHSEKQPTPPKKQTTPPAAKQQGNKATEEFKRLFDGEKTPTYVKQYAEVCLAQPVEDHINWFNLMAVIKDKNYTAEKKENVYKALVRQINEVSLTFEAAKILLQND
jgi:hypothetical protein